MPFFKRKDSKDSGSTNGSSVSHNGNNEKINYKSRLEHKMYLVSSASIDYIAAASVYLSLLSLFDLPWGQISSAKRLGKQKNTRTDLGHVLDTKIILHLKCIAIYSKYLGGMYIGYIKKLLWIVAIREYCDENSKKKNTM